MTLLDVAQMLIGAALGGLVAFAWSQLAFGNRLTKVETTVGHMEREMEGVKQAAKQLAGRRRWPAEE